MESYYASTVGLGVQIPCIAFEVIMPFPDFSWYVGWRRFLLPVHIVSALILLPMLALCDKGIQQWCRTMHKKQWHALDPVWTHCNKCGRTWSKDISYYPTEVVE
jgi:hypothetical protein